MAQPLILPKGVFTNSAEINESIAWAMAMPVDPREIQRLWTVYTTTKKALRDPTAARLENFWWRIWGSRSRELQSITVSALFAYISDGNSFVPLTSSANRDEGTPPAMKQIGFESSSSTAIHRPSPPRHSTAPKISVVPPPSILKNSDSKKKGRGPSTGGPRPTARFISPHESENENTPISPNSHVVVQPPSPVVQEPKGKKTVVSSGKKRAVFVASNGRSKRPVALKRQGSQSSTDSPAKGGELAPSSSDQTPPLFVPQAQERAKQRAQAPSRENSNSSGNTERTQSALGSKSGSTNELSLRKPALGRRKSSKEEAYVDNKPGPSRKPGHIENGQVHEDLTAEELEEIETQRVLLVEANARIQKFKHEPQVTLPLAQNAGLQVDPTSTRKGSNGTLDPAGAGRLAQTRNKSAPSFAPTFVDANGQLEVGERGTARKIDKGKGRALDDPPKDDMFSKRPVQSIAATSVPDSTGSLSRSKSQLTLLLEKDRARSNDHSSDKKGKRQQ